MSGMEPSEIEAAMRQEQRSETMTPELLERPLSLAFSLIADLALALNAHPLNKHPGCWAHAVDAHWWIAVNGHAEPKPAVSPVGCTPSVAPFSCYVEFNGWPAGLLDPFDGIIAAGECANEDAFCAALTAAIVQEQRGKEGAS